VESLGWEKTKNMIPANFTTLTLVLLVAFVSCHAQEGKKNTREFSSPIITDSTSTLFIPVTYPFTLFSSNKSIAVSDYNCANFIVYDFKADTYRKLFEKDAYIRSFFTEYYYSPKGHRHTSQTSKQWIFYMVKDHDFNGNEKINNADPSILYVSNRKGEELRALTVREENVVSLELFEKNGFAMVKIQRDVDKNRKFTDEDHNYYFVKIDLVTLEVGKKIEMP
jgi:hypothetical protein